MDDSFKSLLPLLLPDGLLVYFTLSNHKFDEETLHIYLEEKNVIPDEHTGQKILSKGFFESVTIQDFPIRGRNVIFTYKAKKMVEFGN